MILKDLILEDGALPFQNQITAIQSLILVENTAKKKRKSDEKSLVETKIEVKAK